MSTKIERYLSARIRNPKTGHREASRLAGYVGGSAPKSAISAYKIARHAAKEPQAVEWLKESVERAEEEARRKVEHAAYLRAKLRAAMVASQIQDATL